MVIWNLQDAYAKCILRHSGRVVCGTNGYEKDRHRRMESREGCAPGQVSLFRQAKSIFLELMIVDHYHYIHSQDSGYKREEEEERAKVDQEGETPAS